MFRFCWARPDGGKTSGVSGRAGDVSLPRLQRMDVVGCGRRYGDRAHPFRSRGEKLDTVLAP